MLWIKLDKIVFHHQPGPCQLIKGIEHGSEDMEALPNGMVLITAGMRYEKDLTVSPWKDFSGEIMLYDVNAPEKGATPLTIQGNIDLEAFTPHGISIWREHDKVWVYVVNHPPGRELVEIFTFDVNKPTMLIHEETIASDFFYCINDLVVVGARQFYVTNYCGYSKYPLDLLEMMLMLPAGNVVYYDDKSSMVVVDKVMEANGIQQSKDGKFIYVAMMGQDELRVYERQKNNTLVEKQVVTVGPADNIDVDPVSGDLWLGIHPVPYKLLAHMDDPNLPSPSQVLKLKTKSGLVVDMYEVYSDDGTKYVSGSSVAVRVNNKLLVGTVVHRAVVCELTYLQ